MTIDHTAKTEQFRRSARRYYFDDQDMDLIFQWPWEWRRPAASTRAS
jgi:hypothetical protein